MPGGNSEESLIRAIPPIVDCLSGVVNGGSNWGGNIIVDPLAGVICRIPYKVADAVSSIRYRSHDVVINPLTGIIDSTGNAIPGIISSGSNSRSEARLHGINPLSGPQIVIRRSLPTSRLDAGNKVSGVLHSLVGRINSAINQSALTLISVNRITVCIRTNYLITAKNIIGQPVCGISDSSSNVSGSISDPLSGGICCVAYCPSNIAGGISNPLSGSVCRAADSPADISSSISDPLTSGIKCISNVLASTGFVSPPIATVLIVDGVTAIPPIFNRLSSAGLMRLPRTAIVVDFNILTIPPGIKVIRTVSDPFADVAHRSQCPFSAFSESVSNPVGSIRDGSTGRIPGTDNRVADIFSSLSKPSADVVPKTLLFRGFLTLLSGSLRLFLLSVCCRSLTLLSICRRSLALLRIIGRGLTLRSIPVRLIFISSGRIPIRIAGFILVLIGIARPVRIRIFYGTERCEKSLPPGVNVIRGAAKYLVYKLSSLFRSSGNIA